MHLILEIFMLKLEALACEVNLLDYTVACFNGRVGFVPYLDLIEMLLTSKSAQGLVLDYDNIGSNLCGL